MSISSSNGEHARLCNKCGSLGYHACDDGPNQPDPGRLFAPIPEINFGQVEIPGQNVTWPESSPYFDQTTMDAQYLRALRDADSQYAKPGHQQRVDYIDVKPNHKELVTKPLSQVPLEQRVAFDSTAGCNGKIFFVSQMRRYFNRRTCSVFDLDAASWDTLLDKLSVSPSFLETLHSNNGTLTRQTLENAAAPSSNVDDAGKVGTRAIHIQAKVGKWQKLEFAVYARHDFADNQGIVLIVGTIPPMFPQHVFDRIAASQPFNIFQVLFIIGDMWYRAIENLRLWMDYDTQTHEATTGYSYFRNAVNHPPPLEELIFSRDLLITAQSLRHVVYATTLVGDALEFFKESLTVYHKLSQAYPNQSLTTVSVNALDDAFSLKRSLVRYQLFQTGMLQARIDDQISVTKSLIAQRDTEISIFIAKAAKRDSELMRSITAVTMVFFPATFFAAFFSMAFFHVGSESVVHMMVDQQIWIYPVTMIPFTLAGILWYNLRFKHQPKTAGDHEL